MHNPWTNIPASDYEAHMSANEVLQLQKLNTIFAEQYKDYLPKSVLVLGIATGNGLEHIDDNITENIYGLDISDEFLSICIQRYSHLNNLTLINSSFEEFDFNNMKTDLCIANLFLEYVGLDLFFDKIKSLKHNGTIFSIVIQKNNTNSFVSNTNIKSLDTLSGYHQDIDRKILFDKININGYDLLLEESYPLPNGKEFIRIDFR